MTLLIFIVIAVAVVGSLCVALSNSGTKYACPKTHAYVEPKPMVEKGKVNSKRRFVAIDFETANERYYSACSLGLVIFEDYKPVARKSWLMNPHTKFDPVNIAIHKITPEMVRESPTFDVIWPQLLVYLKECRVVGYSDFDAKVLRSLIKHWKIDLDERLTIDYFDVCKCSRNTILGLANYKLPTVCQYLGITGLNHHDACSDAEACGKIYCWIARNGGRQVTASRDDSASYAQQDYIRDLGGVVPPVLSRSQASALIDQLIQERARKQEEEAQARYLERERRRAEEKKAKQEAKDYERRKKEEASLKLLADEMSDPEYKSRKSRSKRIQDMKEFQVLVNSVIADNIIDADELIEIKSWLVEHKVLDDDFASMLKLIDETLADGKIDSLETQSLYEQMLDCVTILRKRQSA